MHFLNGKNILNDVAADKFEKRFLGFYSFIALFFLSVFIYQYVNGVIGAETYYFLALSLFFFVFFISKLISLLFQLFFKNNHVSLVFLTTLPRLSLFLVVFVFFKNTVDAEMNKHFVLIALCIFFLFSMLEGILKLKLFSRI